MRGGTAAASDHLYESQVSPRYPEKRPLAAATQAANSAIPDARQYIYRFLSGCENSSGPNALEAL